MRPASPTAGLAAALFALAGVLAGARADASVATATVRVEAEQRTFVAHLRALDFAWESAVEARDGRAVVLAVPPGRYELTTDGGGLLPCAPPGGCFPQADAGGICRVADADAGTPCSDYDTATAGCDPHLYCTSGVCEPYLRVGAPCNPGFSGCQNDLWCNGAKANPTCDRASPTGGARPPARG